MRPSYIKKIAVVVLLIIVAGAGIITVNSTYQNRERHVRIEMTTEAPVEVYKGGEVDEHGHAHGSTGEPIETLSKSGDIRLRPGVYVAVIKGSQQFEDLEESFIVRSDGAKATIMPVVRQSVLDAKLANERTPIAAAMYSKYPNLESGYSVRDLSLYGTGEWAGIVITANGHSDFLHVILKKDSSSWSVITKPSIILSQPLYPDIPIEILIDINKKQYEDPQIRQ